MANRTEYRARAVYTCPDGAEDVTELDILESIQRRVLWLSAWMVHQANARPNPDGIKVGGHQASSASVVSLLTALYFGALRSGDVVATKAHAAPAFYAIQFLRGRLSGDRLATRSEERRVGKECRSRWTTDHGRN